MFDLIYTQGQHSVYTYENNPFVDFFKELYQTDNLEQLHLLSEDFNKYKDKISLGVLNDVETDLHQKFYKEIKRNDKFKRLYCQLVKDLQEKFFPDQDCIIYQSFPSVRFQFPESVAVPPHKDSDHLASHPIGEKNFILPITRMEKTAGLYIETEPDNKNFINLNAESGQLMYFNGNTCTHYNEKNKENRLRISLDFRIIKKEDYLIYLDSNSIISSNPRDIKHQRLPKKMMIGDYYQIYFVGENFERTMQWNSIKGTITQSRPYFGKEEADACHDYIMGDNFLTEYKKTEELERIICEKINSRNCIMTTSGTVAIMLGLMALDLNEGDEIIVPNFTMIATINAVKILKLKPVIIDVDIETCTITLDEIRKHVTDKTKVIIHVSLNNRYKNIELIGKYCSENNLIFLEDSAQSLGCIAGEKYLGTYGRMGFFSLSTPKIISTGQGGFIVTDDDRLAKKIRMIKNFGRKESGEDVFEIFGLNFKFNDLQAVVGIEQMKKLDNRIIRMRKIYDLYYSELKDYGIMKEPLSDSWIPWFVDIYVKDRDRYIKILKQHMICTRPVYSEIIHLENSSQICNTGLFLPTHMGISNDEILHIIRIIKLIIQE